MEIIRKKVKSKIKRISDVRTRAGALATAKKRINNALIALKRLENVANSYWDLETKELKQILTELDNQVKETKAKLNKAISKDSGGTIKDGPFKGW